MRRHPAAGEPPGEAPVGRSATAREMEQTLARLHALLAAADAGDLRRRSDGTRWTDEQLLHPMVFGYLIVGTLLPLVRVVSRLPPSVGRGWAALLNSTSRPFHVIDYWGSVVGARVFDRARMGPLADRTTADSSPAARTPDRSAGCRPPVVAPVQRGSAVGASPTVAR